MVQFCLYGQHTFTNLQTHQTVNRRLKLTFKAYKRKADVEGEEAVDEDEGKEEDEEEVWCLSQPLFSLLGLSSVSKICALITPGCYVILNPFLPSS